MNNLIDDFIDRVSSDEIKEIPVDTNDTPVLKTMMPTECSVLEVDMSWLHNQPMEAIGNLYDRLLKDRSVMNIMIHDLAHYGKEYYEAVYNGIISKAQELSESLHFELKYEKLDDVSNLLCMIINVLTYVVDLIQYIEAHYEIEVTESTDEISPADDIDIDDNEDEHVVDMIAAEFVDATGGVPFTNEELYGESKAEE